MKSILHLSALTPAALHLEARCSPYPKWATMCVLRLAGCQVPDAMLIAPGVPDLELNQALQHFAQLHQIDKILLRADAPVESGGYLRGGNSYPLAQCPAKIAEIHGLGRVAILLPRTNRFTNQLSFNLRVSECDDLSVELLGPGFDVSDLNRGLIPPEVFVRFPECSIREYDPPPKVFPGRLLRPYTHPDLVRLRLERIGRELLPAIGLAVGPDPAESARAWLSRSGNTDLLHAQPLVVSYRLMRFFYDTAFTLWHVYRSFYPAQHVVISGSVLARGAAPIFWDISNPAIKFRLILEAAKSPQR